jgi:hypothetical protein
MARRFDTVPRSLLDLSSRSKPPPTAAPTRRRKAELPQSEGSGSRASRFAQGSPPGSVPTYGTIWAVNDTPDAVSLSIGMTSVDVAGPMATVGTYACVCPPNKAVEVARIAATDIAAQEFLSLKWQDVDGKHSGQNDYLPNRPKEYDLRTPKITAVEAGDTVTLTCDVLPST